MAKHVNVWADCCGRLYKLPEKQAAKATLKARGWKFHGTLKFCPRCTGARGAA